MAKQGFSASDRRKVEVLSTLTHTIGVHDCGTIFVLAEGTVGSDATYTLPALADAGEGWWCKFVLSAVKNAGSQVAIAAASGDTLSTIVKTSADAAANQFTVGSDEIDFDGDVDVKGDILEVFVANGEWFAVGVSAA